MLELWEKYVPCENLMVVAKQQKSWSMSMEDLALVGINVDVAAYNRS